MRLNRFKALHEHYSTYGWGWLKFDWRFGGGVGWGERKSSTLQKGSGMDNARLFCNRIPQDNLTARMNAWTKTISKAVSDTWIQEWILDYLIHSHFHFLVTSSLILSTNGGERCKCMRFFQKVRLQNPRRIKYPYTSAHFALHHIFWAKRAS